MSKQPARRQKRQRRPRIKPDEVLWPNSLTDSEFDAMMAGADRRELARFVSIVLERQHRKHESPDEPTKKPAQQ